MHYYLYNLLILASMLVLPNAIDYNQIINATENDHFVNLSTSDFQIIKEFENVDIKQVILDELTHNGEQLTSRIIRFLENPIQESGKLEGDIELPPDINIDLFDTDSWSLAYSAIADSRKRWPNGEIPFLVSSKYGRFSRQQIRKAINHFHKKQTCLTFIPHTNQRDYIVIEPVIGCSSHIGRVGGRQVVSLAAGCTESKTVIHELMHAAGFFHEQARHDRDNYVLIHWNNILPQPAIKKQFDKQNESVISLLGMPYDQNSIMHYKEDAFSISTNLRTISAKNGGTLSNDYGLTDIDVMKINSLYDCVNKSDDSTTTNNPTITNATDPTYSSTSTPPSSNATYPTGPTTNSPTSTTIVNTANDVTSVFRLAKSNSGWNFVQLLPNDSNHADDFNWESECGIKPNSNTADLTNNIEMIDELRMNQTGITFVVNPLNTGTRVNTSILYSPFGSSDVTVVVTVNYQNVTETICQELNCIPAYAIFGDHCIGQNGYVYFVLRMASQSLFKTRSYIRVHLIRLDNFGNILNFVKLPKWSLQGYNLVITPSGEVVCRYSYFTSADDIKSVFYIFSQDLENIAQYSRIDPTVRDLYSTIHFEKYATALRSWTYTPSIELRQFYTYFLRDDHIIVRYDRDSRVFKIFYPNDTMTPLATDHTGFRMQGGFASRGHSIYSIHYRSICYVKIPMQH